MRLLEREPALDALGRAARLPAPVRQVLEAAAVMAPPPVDTWLLVETAGAAPAHVTRAWPPSAPDIVLPRANQMTRRRPWTSG